MKLSLVFPGEADGVVENGGLERDPDPALAVLAWELLRLGAVAFGGLGATLALLQRGLVDKRGWLKQEDISEALAITQALPGSTGIQVVSYLGWRLRGWPGAIVAAVAFIAPAFRSWCRTARNHWHHPRRRPTRK